MAIFGSYIGRERRLFGESFHIASLDTLIALLAGLIIFPAAFAFGIDPGEGAGLVFITLPSIFNSMVGGYFFGLLFFLALLFAALSTVIAVFENIIAFMMDLTKSSRKRAVLINAIALPLLSIPTALGFNVWSSFAPLGEGTLVIDLLDFLVSNNILPLGSLVFLMFCVSKKGWGWDNFVAEADAGEGMKIPKLRLYYTYIIPIIILFVFVVGYREKFFQ